MDNDVDASFLLAGGMIFDGGGGPLYAGDVLVDQAHLPIPERRASRASATDPMAGR
ncbi:MAG: hypothetical protein ABJD24_05020 [Acidimicrobiales bacterium]